MQARKKQKLDENHFHNGSNTPQRTARGKIQPQIEGRQPLRVEDLAWQDVDPPDRLDDYEGFYGLEEVDGVDVIRDGETGRVSFQNANKRSRDEQVKGKSSSAQRSQEPVKGARKIAEESAVEWDGFEDDSAKTPNGQQDTPLIDRRGDSNVGISNQTSEDPLESPKHHTNIYDILEEAAEEDGIDVSAWDQLDLPNEIVIGISGMKFSTPTPVQKAAIPYIREGRDVIGKAPTGSGKTLAFGIPILEYLLAQRQISGTSPHSLKEKPPAALIVSPTRELAHQISDHLTILCSRMPSDSPSIATLTGGLSIQKQHRLFATADIVVGTPGRLWEVVSNGHGVLSQVRQIRFLVIDEADRLLSQGHFKELESLLSAIERREVDDEHHPPQSSSVETSIPRETKRQTLVFSATLSRTLHFKLTKSHPSTASSHNDPNKQLGYLLTRLPFQRDRQPTYIDTDPAHALPSTLSESLLECPQGIDKDLYLYYILLLTHTSHPSTGTLIFVNSIHAVRRLVPFLANLALPALPLHSQMPQKARLQSIERFSSTTTTSPAIPNPTSASNKTQANILIATDVAARGLDIPLVNLIIHYHVPRTADGYVHRSGRTARAQRHGASVLICAPHEAAGVRRLVAQVHAKRPEQRRDPGPGDDERARKKEGLRPLNADATIAARLKPRAALAKSLADAALAKDRANSRSSELSAAREELGSDGRPGSSDEDEFEFLGSERGAKKGRGRREREEVARGMTKAEMRRKRAKLREMLGRRVNTGVSERYVAGGVGGVDLGRLVEERAGKGGVGMGGWLGVVPDLGLGL